MQNGKKIPDQVSCAADAKNYVSAAHEYSALICIFTKNIKAKSKVMTGIFKQKKTNEIKESELLLLLQEDETNDRALAWIFQQWKADAVAFIRSKNVPEDEAEDIFMEAMLALIKNAKEGKLKGVQKIRQYFNSICYNEAMDFHKKRHAIIQLILPIESFPEHPITETEEVVQQQRISEIVALCHETIRLLKEKCQQLLTLKAVGFSMAEIATKMELLHERAAINQASRCREKLRELTESNPIIMNKIKELL